MKHLRCLVSISFGCHYAECYCVECHYDKCHGAQMSPLQKWNYFLSLIWNLRPRTKSSMLQLVSSSAKLRPWLIFTLYRYLRTHTHTLFLSLSLSLRTHTHTLSGLTHYLSQDTHTISLKTHILSGHTLSGHTTPSLKTHTLSRQTDRHTLSLSFSLSLSLKKYVPPMVNLYVHSIHTIDWQTDYRQTDSDERMDRQTDTDGQADGRTDRRSVLREFVPVNYFYPR